MKLSRLEAAKKHYEARASEAEEIIQIYLTSAVGIGEHPQIMEELRKQIEELSFANDCISNIDSLLQKWSYKGTT
jgi:hypothetical protein